MNINPRKIWEETKKPYARILLFLVTLGIIVWIYNIRNGVSGTTVNSDISAEAQASSAPASISTGYTFRYQNAEPASRKEKGERREEPIASRVIQAVSEQTVDPPPPIPQTIFAKKETDPQIADEFLPFGQLIKCQLANTIESTNLDTPIFGYVIEDIYGPGGNLIIPAGTEVHGEALKSSSRDRIGAQTKFILVFIKTGKELKLTASVLDHAPSRNSSEKWAETDGSGGLRGYQIKFDKYAEAKAILGSALAAGATAFPEQINQMGPFGTMTSMSKGGWQSALSEGIGAGTDIYARRLLDAMKELYYVRIDAGTYFYLYSRQTISLADAKIGGSKEQTPPSQHPSTEIVIQ